MTRRPSKLSWLMSLLALGVLLSLRLLGAARGDEQVPATQARPEPEARPTPTRRVAHHAQRASAAIASNSAWASPAACEAALQAQPRKGRAGVEAARIATWNLAWFPDGAANGPSLEHAHDVAWMACVMAWLNVPVIAVQEVVQHPRGRAALLDLLQALDLHTHGHWRFELDSCPDDGRQHVGFLYDSARVTFSAPRMLRELNPGRSACDRRLRPGFAAHFGFADGFVLNAVTVHLDSGETPRDYGNRKTSVERLAEVLPRLTRAREPVVVLGDFNTMGCEACVPKVAAQQELDALDATINGSSPALRRVPADHECSEYYRGRGTLLDHVLLTDAPRSAASARVRVLGPCAELDCEHTTRSQLPAAFDHLSDHCPLVLSWQRTN